MTTLVCSSAKKKDFPSTRVKFRKRPRLNTKRSGLSFHCRLSAKLTQTCRRGKSIPRQTNISVYSEHDKELFMKTLFTGQTRAFPQELSCFYYSWQEEAGLLSAVSMWPAGAMT